MRYATALFLSLFLPSTPLQADASERGNSVTISSSCDRPFPPGVYFTSCTSSSSPLGDNSRWEALQKKADDGNASSQLVLGTRYYYGRATQKDYKEAIKWFRRAAEQGSVLATLWIGYIYAEGGYGIEKNYKEAAKWYLAAAKKDDRDAYLFLGHLYKEGGHGIAKDYAEAYFWFSFPSYQIDTVTYRDSAAQHLTPRQISEIKERLRRWKTEHKVSAIDLPVPTKASISDLMESANKGAADAQWNLGKHYFDGLGVPQNYTEAYYWFALAKKGGWRFVNFPPPKEWYLAPDQISAIEKRVNEWKSAAEK